MSLDVSSPELRFALDSVSKVARLASQIQKGVALRGLTKSDLTPVTVADYAGQAVVGKALADFDAGATLVGEESAGDARVRALIDLAGAALTPVARHSFDSLGGERALKARLSVASLEGFGGFARPELAAIAALLGYVEITQVGHRPHLRLVRSISYR